MKRVNFDNNGSYPVFEYEGEDGSIEYLEYKPPLNGLWPNFDIKSFCVELLVNPYLTKEVHTFQLLNEHGNRIGVVFPISLLDSDQPFEKDYISNYVFAAYWYLLQRIVRLEKIPFSANFEDNVCVVVLCRTEFATQYPLDYCIHGLRSYGYSFFTPNNTVKPVPGYKVESILTKGASKLTNTLRINVQIPALYSDDAIRLLMESLRDADNIINRFVLLYQVFEALMEDSGLRIIRREVAQLDAHCIAPREFLVNVKDAISEKSKIIEIFNASNIPDEDKELFENSCTHLFDMYGHKTDYSLPEMLYEFRNQMIHSYRELLKFQDELALTIQGMERVVLSIIGLYPKRSA